MAIRRCVCASGWTVCGHVCVCRRCVGLPGAAIGLFVARLAAVVGGVCAQLVGCWCCSNSGRRAVVVLVAHGVWLCVWVRGCVCAALRVCRSCVCFWVCVLVCLPVRLVLWLVGMCGPECPVGLCGITGYAVPLSLCVGSHSRWMRARAPVCDDNCWCCVAVCVCDWRAACRAVCGCVSDALCARVYRAAIGVCGCLAGRLCAYGCRWRTQRHTVGVCVLRRVCVFICVQ